MPRARTKRGRLRQVEHWLVALFPPPRTTRVRVCDLGKGEYGDVSRYGSDLVVRIHSHLPLGIALYFLFHEWAHAMTWTLAKIEHTGPEHPDEWGLAEAKIMRAFMEEGGCENSCDYPED